MTFITMTYACTGGILKYYVTTALYVHAFCGKYHRNGYLSTYAGTSASMTERTRFVTGERKKKKPEKFRYLPASRRKFRRTRITFRVCVYDAHIIIIIIIVKIYDGQHLEIRAHRQPGRSERASLTGIFLVFNKTNRSSCVSVYDKYSRYKTQSSLTIKRKVISQRSCTHTYIRRLEIVNVCFCFTDTREEPVNTKYIL